MHNQDQPTASWSAPLVALSLGTAMEPQTVPSYLASESCTNLRKRFSWVKALNLLLD